MIASWGASFMVKVSSLIGVKYLTQGDLNEIIVLKKNFGQRDKFKGFMFEVLQNTNGHLSR